MVEEERVGEGRREGERERGRREGEGEEEGRESEKDCNAVATMCIPSLSQPSTMWRPLSGTAMP